MYSNNHSLPRELADESEVIIHHAITKYGLSFDPIEFVLLDHHELNAVAAYGGFINRYPHWTFGMDYEQLKKGYDYGASKIYELVINNNPVYAYLMKSNPIVDQKLVMAHVCGHADFFKNNLWFAPTNKSMLDQMASNGNRIRRISEAVGQSEVEQFIDQCLTIDNLLDPHSIFIKQQRSAPKDEGYDPPPEEIVRLPAKDYLDKYVNTKEFIEEQRERHKQESAKKKKSVPEAPVRDVVGFLVENAPLSRWKRDILAMLREEAYYFIPQRMTKIINEGWASFIHSKLMTEKLLTDSEVIDYCDHHSGVLAGEGFNPYKVGIELFRDIEDRWNRGAFGPEYEACEDEETKKNWNKRLNQGWEKVLQVRQVYNDVTFIEDFFTKDFCARNKMFIFEDVETTEQYTVASAAFDKAKQGLLTRLTNFGNPIIELINANYNNRGELYLKHVFDGRELDMKKAADVLESLFNMWTKPVSIESIVSSKPTVLRYDGNEHKLQQFDSDAVEADVEEVDGDA